MPEFLSVTYDKFTFRVAADRFYTPEGVWAAPEGSLLRVGLSDFAGQRSGDIAFVEVKPAGTRLSFNDELAALETIKVNLILGSPAAGAVQEVNSRLAREAELVNADPYGGGWFAVLRPDAWESDRQRLLDPAQYVELVRRQAEDAEAAR